MESTEQAVNELLPGKSSSTVFIVDDDPFFREAMTQLLETESLNVEAYSSAESFLDSYNPERRGCVILDVSMPKMDGLDMQEALAERSIQLPIIFLSGKGNISTAVQALKAGAVDFLEKPVPSDDLLKRIYAALQEDEKHQEEYERKTELMERLDCLTPREREIMGLLASGMSNKKIGRKLNISYRTVEVHRSRIMQKMQADSFPKLIEMARICDLF